MKIVFSDLDGSLLNSSCSYEGAEESLKRLKERGIKLSIVTSKTFEEVVPYWKEFGFDFPFAFENGNGIAAPPGVLPEVHERIDAFEIVSLGPEYEELKGVFDEVKEEVKGLKAFGDLTVEELSELLDFSEKDAELAKQRRHEVVFFPHPEAEQRLEEKGYGVIEGTQFYHLMGKVDKGTAVEYLNELFDPETTLSIGDSENDHPMFKKTDWAILLGLKSQKEELRELDVRTIKKKGPEGWSEGIEWFLEKLGNSGS